MLVEPYAPNIVRVSLSLRRDDALAAARIWRFSQTSGDWLECREGSVWRCASIFAHGCYGLAAGGKWVPTGTQADIAKFFNGSYARRWFICEDSGRRAAGAVRRLGWQMSVPNHKDGNARTSSTPRPTDPPFFQVGATFASPQVNITMAWQNQEGYLEPTRPRCALRASYYNAPSGQSVCVPFVVTNKGYGIVWDNPSATTVAFGFNNSTRWTSDVGQRVSFFRHRG